MRQTLIFKSRWILPDFFLSEDGIHSKDSLFCLQLGQCPPSTLKNKKHKLFSIFFPSLYVKFTNYKTITSQLQGITQPYKTDVDTNIS